MLYTQLRPAHSEKRKYERKNLSKMSNQKLTYADILKNQSGFLNPGMDPTPLIPKAPRVCLGEEAVQKLHGFIHGTPNLSVTSATPNQPESIEKKRGKPPKVYSAKQSSNQPLVLASASAGILPGFTLNDRHVMQSSVNSSYVSLMNPNEIGSVVREGVMENPIEVLDDSDNETVKLDDNECLDQRSTESADVHLKASDFDADEFLKEVNNQSAECITKSDPKPLPELDRMLRLNPTKALTKSKRRM